MHYCSDFEDLKKAKRSAESHTKETGHRYRFSEFGAVCRQCPWKYLAVRLPVADDRDYEDWY